MILIELSLLLCNWRTRYSHIRKIRTIHVQLTETLSLSLSLSRSLSPLFPPQWGAADKEIKVPSGENTELKRSPFTAWSRSVYSHACYAYCQGFLPCLFIPFRSIPLHFFQNLSRFLLCWLWLTLGSCEGLHNKIGYLAGCRFQC